MVLRNISRTKGMPETLNIKANKNIGKIILWIAKIEDSNISSRSMLYLSIEITSWNSLQDNL